MKKRFIFDLDGILLHGDFSKEIEYFRSVLGEEDYERFIKVYYELLMKYESIFRKYEVHKLSEFLKGESKANITDEIIEGWIDINSTMNNIIDDGVIETLEYLKSKDKSLVVLTNWFLKSQKERLKNAKLLKYFDEVYAGDSNLKPNKESYLNACGDYNVDECIIIGDTIEKDVICPNKFGIDSIYYNPENKEYDKTKILSINSFNKIKEMF